MTAASHYSISAYFANRSDADKAARELQAAGFSAGQINTSEQQVARQDSRTLTSDEYSPDSATASVAAHPESFADKVRDFFAGETADSDINDHSITNQAHVDISARSYRESSVYVVTVRASDRVAEAGQILTRNNGELSDKPEEYPRVPEA
jgi:hypothetical protein